MNFRGTVSIEEVLASAEKYGDNGIFKMDLEKVRDNKQRQKDKKKKVYDCTWIPLVFKKTNGEEIPYFKMFMKNQLAGSSAKKPSWASDEQVKSLYLSFKRMYPSDIEGGDYVAKTMNDEKSQLKEDQRIQNKIKNLDESNLNFIKALDIIDKSYQHCCNELKNMKITTKENGFSLKKKPEWKESSLIPINSFVQRKRKEINEETEEEELVSMEPLYRIKLLTDPETGYVGYIPWKDKPFYNNVFDLKKTKKAQLKGFNKLIPAKVRAKDEETGEEYGDPDYLTVNTAGDFITYKSLLTGVIEFREIVISGQGMSLSNQFKDLYVVHHKNSYNQNEVDESLLNELISDNDLSDSEEGSNEEDLKPADVESNETDEDFKSEDELNIEDDE